jgi:hypothetical protein
MHGSDKKTLTLNYDALNIKKSIDVIEPGIFFKKNNYCKFNKSIVNY